MVNLLQIDKSGRDIFEKDYSIVLVVNKEKVYGINIPQNIKDRILQEYNLDRLWKKKTVNKKYRMRLRVRFHTAVIFLLIKRYISENSGANNLSIELCNDFDGHFHEIRDMLYKNIKRILPIFKFEDILQVKFNKPSLVDNAGIDFRKKTNNIENYYQLKINLNELLEILRK